MTKQKLQSSFQLISDSAARGDNIGVDEYPTAGLLEYIVNHESSCTALTLSNIDGSPRMEALILVTPCRYVRSYRSTFCSIVLVTVEELACKMIWKELIHIAQEAARTSSYGHSACLVDVFVTCIKRMLAMREEGFLITACVPEAGRLVKTGSGYVANYLMYKDLAVGDILVSYQNTLDGIAK